MFAEIATDVNRFFVSLSLGVGRALAGSTHCLGGIVEICKLGKIPFILNL